MANFALPGLFQLYNLNKAFVDTCVENRAFVNDDCYITSIYGCFPTSIWNGGRKILGFCSSERVNEEISFFNAYKISVSYTFTNPFLLTEHLSDTFCNLCMNIANNGMNNVIINSNVLENYIRIMYPKFRIISSATKCLLTIQELEKECQLDYKLVVADYSLNHNKNLLHIANKNKLELLLNAYCKDNCTERKEHYQALANNQLKYSEKQSFHECKYSYDDFYTIKRTRKNFIKKDEIFQVFLPNGIKNFKIEGRTNNYIDVLESYMYYLIKAEYKDECRSLVLKKII